MSFFDLSRGTAKCELAGRAIICGALGTPSCLSPVGSETGGLFWGDTAGAVSLLSLVPGLPAKQLTHEGSGTDFHIMHKEHTDWVTQVIRAFLPVTIIYLCVYLYKCMCRTQVWSVSVHAFI